MIVLIILVIGIPLTFAIFILQHEGRNLYYELQRQIFSGHVSVPDFIRELPIIGKEVTRTLKELNTDPQSITQNVAAWIQGHLGYGRFVLNEISKNIIKLCFAIMSLFFFYRDGQTILRQVSTAMEKVIGPRIHHYMDTISETTRAVVYYVVAGVPNPMVLTIATFLLALIPFGTPVAYGSVALWLFSQGQTVEAIGVFAWGVCIVSTSDNVIRPLVISGATQIPFLLIMFGVLGGVASFGLVGLFIGPVILAVILAIWREWLHETTEPEPMPDASLAYEILNDEEPPKSP